MVVRLNNLRNGQSQSCGCRHREIVSANRKHGDWNKQLYKVWCAMKQRCSNPNSRVYGYYGGRGISVCREWQESYLTFREWATASGYERGLTLDRIDNDGDYEPSNCRWVSMSVQNSNKRICRSKPCQYKSVEAFDSAGEVVMSFESVKAAGEAMTGASSGRVHISNACRGVQKTAYGYKWRFADVT